MIDTAVFIMNKPDFQPKGSTLNDNIVVFTTRQTYRINQVYEFYGQFFSVTPGSTCMVILNADSREDMNHPIFQ